MFQSHAKMRRESAEKSAASQWAPCSRGCPMDSISAFLSRQHVTQSPLGRRTQGEHVTVHRGMHVAFAPRFFKKSKSSENPFCETLASTSLLPTTANQNNRNRGLGARQGVSGALSYSNSESVILDFCAK